MMTTTKNLVNEKAAQKAKAALDLLPPDVVKKVIKSTTNKRKRHLTPKEREEIIKYAIDPNIAYYDIAKLYNVTARTISNIALNAGIRRRSERSDTGKQQKKEVIKETSAPIHIISEQSLLDQLEEKFDAIEQNLRKWEDIKHEACHKIDTLRKSRQEHYIALQALQRAKEANGTTVANFERNLKS